MRNPLGLKGEEWVDSKSKRELDKALVLGSSPLTAILGAAALTVARILDGNQAIFKQNRYGKGCELFEVTKITTMREDEDPDADGGLITTDYGKKVRPYAIDEIPQLISILKGDMSLVGPRALSSKTLDGMRSTLDRNTFDEWLNAFMLSRPGGLSSYGIAIRNPDFTEKTYLAKAKMDISDFNEASFTHDLGIIRRAGSVGIRRLLSIGILVPEIPQPKEMHVHDKVEFGGSMTVYDTAGNT